jgi:hypothetical protein
VKLSANYRLIALGIFILAAMVACPHNSVGTTPFLICLGVAGTAYLLAIREFLHTPRFPRHVLLFCLALSVVWRIPFLLTPPGPDDDIRRYLWDGRLQRLGYNPYDVVPSDPAVAELHTLETRGLNHPELPSPYPAGAQLFFRLVANIRESIFAFKIAFVLCDFAIVLILMKVLRASGQGEHWLLAYAWHPLLATNVAGSGHIDIVGVLLLVISVAALGRRLQTIAAIAFALAVSVKFLPIVLAPLYWRRVRVRDGLLAAAVFGLLYLPFLEKGHLPIGSLGTYVQSFRFNDPAFAMLERVGSPQIVGALAVLLGVITAASMRSKQSLSADKWAWPMAASLAWAPVIYPWYLLWFLPFLTSRSTLPIAVWTISILPTYIVWHLRSLGYIWRLPKWVLLLEYGSTALAAVLVCLRRPSEAVSRAAPERALPASYVPADVPTKHS